MIGWVVLPLLGPATLLLANSKSVPRQRFGIQLLGVQACISAWSQFDYLFNSAGRVGGRMNRSDTAAIADALLLPYWFWGTAISAMIIALLWWSFGLAFDVDTKTVLPTDSWSCSRAISLAAGGRLSRARAR